MKLQKIINILGLNKRNSLFQSKEQGADSLSPVIRQLVDNMVRVEGGTFLMGSNRDNNDDETDLVERPIHQVTLSSFSIGRFEVTQEEWQALMGDTPTGFKSNKMPVKCVSWRDCQKFIKNLNKLTGKNFRLPTEAEWEFAARGGNDSHGFRYSGSDCLDDVAWYSDNCIDDGAESLENGTHEVGRKSPNELGLYDMSGNVYEWCLDKYGEYGSAAQTNPKGPSSGTCRVLRGGSWTNYEQGCTVSCRSFSAPGMLHAIVGFRLAL